MKRILPLILLGLLTCDFVHADVLLPSLIAWFPLDIDASDQSGNGNNGFATKVDFRAGGTGSVGIFGKMSSISVADNKTFDFSSATGISITVRIKPEVRNNGYIVVKKGPASSRVDEYALSLTEDGHVTAEFVENANNRIKVVSNSVLNLNTWYDIIIIWKRNGDVSLYIGGVLDTFTTSAVTSVQNTSFPLIIGDPDTLSSNSVVGSMEDINIYNRALMSDEIAEFTIYKPTGITPGSEEEDCIIYPNPVRDEVTVSTSLKFRNAEYRLTDMDGKLLMKGLLITGNFRLNLAYLKPGLYNLQIDNGNRSVNRKIVKQ